MRRPASSRAARGRDKRSIFAADLSNVDISEEERRSRSSRWKGLGEFLAMRRVSSVSQRLPASGSGALHQQHLLAGIDLLELDLDDLVVGGLHHSPYVLRLHRQLAMSAIDQHQQLHLAGATVVEERIEGGARGAA